MSGLHKMGGDKMITVIDALKTDPYRDKKTAAIHIDKNTFYSEINGVYVKPSKELCEKCCSSIENGNSNIKLFHINGYAGCGKTLFAHYMMYKYGYDDEYYYEFDQGEGKDYSLDYISKKMILQLSSRIAKISRKDESILIFFNNIIKNIYGESAEYKMLDELANGYSWLEKSLCKQYGELSELQYSLTIKESMEKITDSKEYNIKDVLKFILFCDYFWRCSEVVNGLYGDDKNKYIFCLLDNLDNLSPSAVVDFYVAVRDVIAKLLNHQDIFQFIDNKSFTEVKCVVLFPTREVTQKKLRDGLRKLNYDYNMLATNIVFSFELEDCYPPSDKIIESRKQYLIRKNFNQDVINKIDVVEKLMKIPYVNTQFSALLNGNYSLCVDRIFDIWCEMPELVNECENLQNCKKYNSDFVKCAQEGTRGFLLRMLLEIFKDRNVYESVTDLDAPNNFNVSGKLGLSQLNYFSAKKSYSVSISRLILTFIQSSNYQKVRINHIFRFFSDYDGEEICRYLYALCENIRDTWRRLIVFSDHVPSCLDDLYNQYKLYTLDPKMPSNNFSEVELCLSAKTYLQYVIPNFEFFSSRISIKKKIDVNPPLFSMKSIAKSSDGKRICIKTIENVLKSVENCSNEIFKYDSEMIKKCVNDKNYEIEEISKLFFPANSKYHDVKQSHLSRIIFSHISYIERFRRYFLNLISDGSDVLNEEAIQLNEQLVSYIIRYLSLFDTLPFEKEYSKLLSNKYLDNNFKDNLKKKKTCKCILNNVNAQQEFKQFNLLSDEINIGYNNQERAQIKLLEEILNIHENEYKIISKIEIDNQGELNGK